MFLFLFFPLAYLLRLILGVPILWQHVHHLSLARIKVNHILSVRGGAYAG